MALAIDDLAAAVDPGEDTSEEALSFVEKMGDRLKTQLHVTIGTRSKDVNPFEARALVESWRNGQNPTPGGAISLKDASSRGRIKGLMQ